MTGGPICANPNKIKPSHTEISHLAGIHWVKQKKKKPNKPVLLMPLLLILQELGGADILGCPKGVLLICPLQSDKASSKGHQAGARTELQLSGQGNTPSAFSAAHPGTGSRLGVLLGSSCTAVPLAAARGMGRSLCWASALPAPCLL